VPRIALTDVRQVLPSADAFLKATSIGISTLEVRGLLGTGASRQEGLCGIIILQRASEALGGFLCGRPLFCPVFL
jgi:hypothetical protein